MILADTIIFLTGLIDMDWELLSLKNAHVCIIKLTELTVGDSISIMEMPSYMLDLVSDFLG
jgi:hypothetical protein